MNVPVLWQRSLLGMFLLWSLPATAPAEPPVKDLPIIAPLSQSYPVGPQTHWHYAPNGDFSGRHSPGTCGYNLADVSDVAALDALPPDVKGLVWLGLTDGVNAAFIARLTPFLGRHPKLFGFYLADEPDPTGKFGPRVLASNLKAESDWIHTNIRGAVTFLVLMNLRTDAAPSFADSYTPANTGIDLYGVDPYPVHPQFHGGVDYTVIPASVSAAVASGIPVGKIVPVYQAFGGGGYASWSLPTPEQARQLLQVWGEATPTPVFDMTYSWGSQAGDKALSGSPALQAVFSAHNISLEKPAAGAK